MSPGKYRAFFFDLDDTIYDRTNHRLGIALGSVEGYPAVEGLKDRSFTEYVEAIRGASPIFLHLGYRDTRDRIERPLFLACIYALFVSVDQIRHISRLPKSVIHSARGFFRRFSRQLVSHPPSTWRDYLMQQLWLRRAVLDPAAGSLTQLIDSLIGSNEIKDLAVLTEDTAKWECRSGFRELWRWLEDDGVDCFIASEGDDALQEDKLSALGLGKEYHQKLLTSELASIPLDTAAFRAHEQLVFREVAQTSATVHPPKSQRADAGLRDVQAILTARPDVASIAAIGWALSAFSRKSPAYYARVIQAAIKSPGDPRSELRRLESVSDGEWARRQVRIAMLGNYHEKDVVPLQQLVGPLRVWTGLLNEGVHRGIRPVGSAFPPTRNFDSWADAVRTLMAGSLWDEVLPLRSIRVSRDANVEEVIRLARMEKEFQVGAGVADFFDTIRS